MNLKKPFINAMLFSIVWTQACSFKVKFPIEQTETPSTSVTSSIDGVWETPCTPTSFGWGMKYSLKVENGTFTSVVVGTPGDTTCSRNGIVLEGDFLQPIGDYPSTTTPLLPLTIEGVPSNFSLWEGDSYSLSYQVDETHMQLLIGTSTSNYGTSWSDWLTGGVDIPGFVADPTNFVATVPDSFNLTLEKVTSSFTPRTTAATFTELSGIWNSPCVTDGSDGIKRTLIYQTDGTNVFVSRTWSGDTTCTGPATSFATPLELESEIGAEITNQRYAYHSRIDAYNLDVYSLIMMSGDYMLGSKPSGSNDGMSVPNRHTEIDMDYIYTKDATANNASLYGTWVSNCLEDSGTSNRVTVTYSAPNVFSSPQETWNSNTTCSGAADSTSTVTGTYNIGTHYMGGVEYDIHITSGGDIYFVALIFGNYMYTSTSAVGPNDGSTPQLRIPFIGGAGFYYTKQ